MVMITAGRKEHRLRAVFRHGVEAERPMPPILGRGRVADPQMHMADNRVFRRTLPACAARGYRTANAGHVHALRSHGDLVAVPLPLGGHAVGINLDAVALGIGEVERFADQMVRRAVDLDLTLGGEIYPAA